MQKRKDNKEAQTLWPVIIYNTVKDQKRISSPLCENVHIQLGNTSCFAWYNPKEQSLQLFLQCGLLDSTSRTDMRGITGEERSQKGLY